MAFESIIDYQAVPYVFKFLLISCFCLTSNALKHYLRQYDRHLQWATTASTYKSTSLVRLNRFATVDFLARPSSLYGLN